MTVKGVVGFFGTASRGVKVKGLTPKRFFSVAISKQKMPLKLHQSPIWKQTQTAQKTRSGSGLKLRSMSTYATNPYADKNLLQLLQDRNIGILGVGHMGGGVLVSLARQLVPRSQLFAANRTRSKAESFVDIATIAENEAVIRDCEILVLGGKPKDIVTQCRQVGAGLKGCKYLSERMIISVAASVELMTIENEIGLGKLNIIRSMPIVSMAVGQGVAGMIANLHASPKSVAIAEKMFSGEDSVVNWLDDETAMHVWTSGIASLPGWYTWHLAEWRNFLIAEAREDGREIDPLQLIKMMLQTIKELHLIIEKNDYDLEKVAKSIQKLRVSHFDALPEWYCSHLKKWRDKILEVGAEDGQKFDCYQMTKCMLLTIKGAILSIEKRNYDLDSVMTSVMSTRGTTVAAIEAFKNPNDRDGIRAGTNRSKEMAQEYNPVLTPAPSFKLR